MNLDPNLSREDAMWLITEFKPKMGYRVDHHNMHNIWLKARRIITGQEVGMSDCACHFLSFVKITNSLFGQYEMQIKEVAHS